MRCRLILTPLIALAALAGPWAGASDDTLDRGVGQRVADFSLPDSATGKRISLYSHRGKRAVVIVFIGTGCPVNNLYLPRLDELAKLYAGRGVAFLAINANAGEPADRVAAHAREHKLGFPVLKDDGNVVADQLQVHRTGEVLLVDGRAQLRYRGAVDDQYAVGSRKDAPTRRYLVDALDAVLAGRAVGTPASAVAGCPIERVEPRAVAAAARLRAAPPAVLADLERAAPAVKVGQVSWAADVAPILQARCQSCHRPGQGAPFALLSYDDTRRHARALREAVAERRMPPWHADPRHGQFSNDRSLSPRDRAVLLAWVDQGTPAGDLQAAPAPKAFADGWLVGTPDVVFTMPQPYTVAAQGTLPYQHFRVPTNFKDDRWIQAAEARPGDRSVVHHIVVHVDDHGKNRDGLAGSHLCVYAPGDMATAYPDGTAKRIPAGADLVFQLHYTPVGRERVDRSSVGLIFAKKPVAFQALTVAAMQRQFEIPAGAAEHPVQSSFTLPRDARLVSLMPHMHLRGKDFLYRATYPDGREETLLSVPAYDFAWQSTYRLAEPKPLPRGTRIDCLAHFDNSSANLANPDPTKVVRWGDQTFEEMMIGYMDVVVDAAKTGKAADPSAK